MSSLFFEIICMKIIIYAISKETFDYYEKAIAEFEKRINHYCKFECVLIQPKTNNALSVEETKKIETTFLLKKISTKDSFLFFLDEKGEQFTTMSFTNFIQRKMQSGIKNLCFCIGGRYGWDAEQIKDFNKIRLSDFVLPHQLARLVLTEQLYRVFTIIQHENYHH
jgi:23S rRNA (pseudouridine1915-N3)-methyltransferase